MVILLQVPLALVFLVFPMAEGALQPNNLRNQFDKTYECVNGIYCRRTNKAIATIYSDHSRSNNEHTSLAACRLVCGDTAGLWPIPTGSTNYGNNYVKIDPLETNFEMNHLSGSSKSYLAKVSTIFMKNLQLTCGSQCERINSTMTIRINLNSNNTELDWNTDESYRLDVRKTDNGMNASIIAGSIFGARHALETLSQLAVQIITQNGGKGLVILNTAHVEDSPIFPHRGLLIDTARNYLPITDIIRTIDALGSTKMNILHWHATDSQSFPLQIKSRPSMSQYGAYSSQMIYTPEDLNDIVNYAKLRGVRIILEIDSPSHAGTGWEWGPLNGLGDIAVCINKQPWRNYCIQPPCGQLNPINPNTYSVLRDIYGDILGTIGIQSTLHLGGDEVHINCWNSTAEITDFLESKGMGRTLASFLEIWGTFHAEQAKILDDLKGTKNSSIILWSSALTSPEIITRHLDKKRFVIQTWVEANSTLPEELLKLGYRLIMSTKNSWYLDHGFWGRTQYHTWRDAYNNLIPRTSGVLGGEACMWGEYVNGGGLDSRVWPRAAAVAERLWSDPINRKTTDVEPRLQSHKSRLETMGIYADALTPEWCNQHEGMCM